MPSGLFYLESLDRSISNRRCAWTVFIITLFYRFPIFNANSVDPDQTPHSVASDQDIHSSPMSLLWGVRLQ